jgi:hypothetical protein
MAQLYKQPPSGFTEENKKMLTQLQNIVKRFQTLQLTHTQNQYKMCELK